MKTDYCIYDSEFTALEKQQFEKFLCIFAYENSKNIICFVK